MTVTAVARVSMIALVLALAGCGTRPSNNTVDAPGPDSTIVNAALACTGSATRCDGSNYQTCIADVFTTQSSCSSLCSPTLGCVDCAPTAGSATCNGSAAV